METVSDYNKKIQNIKKKIIFLFQREKYDLTINECKTLLQEKTNDYSALSFMSLSYKYLDNNNKALEVALSLIENYPENSYAHRLCGDVYFNMGSLKFAINYCNKAIELDPKNGDAYYIKAFSLKKLGGEKNMQEAVILTEKVLSLDPEYYEYHTFAAGLYTHVGQYYRAKEEGKRALELNSESPNAYLNYGCSLIYLGELEDSIENFYECLRVNPNNEIARKNIGVVTDYIENPEIYHNYLEKRFFDKDLKRDSNSEAFVILANIFLKQGEYYKALNVFYKFFQINKKAVKRHISYAEILYSAGALSEALSYLKVVKKSNPREKEIDDHIQKIYRKAREDNIKIHSVRFLKGKVWKKLWRRFTDFSFPIGIIKSIIIIRLLLIIIGFFR